jgi:hypothetical protein
MKAMSYFLFRSGQLSSVLLATYFVMGCASRSHRYDIRDAVIEDNHLKVLVQARIERELPFTDPATYITERESVGIATIALNAGSRIEMQLHGAAGFKYNDEEPEGAVYWDLLLRGLGPGHSFLRFRSDGYVERFEFASEGEKERNAGASRTFLGGRRMSTTSDRKWLLICGDSPRILDLASLGPVPSAAIQRMSQGACMTSDECTRIGAGPFVSDDLQSALVQCAQRAILWEASDPERPKEWLLPISQSVRLIQNVDGELWILTAELLDGRERYRLTVAGQSFLAPEHIRGFAVADSRFDRVVSFSELAPVRLRPKEKLRMTIWHPRTGREEMIEVDVRRALKDIWNQNK